MPDTTEPQSSLVLSIEEMQAIARPHAEPAEIARWFHENGFTFKVAPDGYPIVSRQHFEGVMGSINERGICLTPAEITEITGKTQPAAQLRHLKRMGIRAHRRDDPDNPICVLREWLTSAPVPATLFTVRPKRQSEIAREQTAQAR